MIDVIALLGLLLHVGLNVKQEKFSVHLGNSSPTKLSQLKVHLLVEFFPKPSAISDGNGSEYETTG